ncbi:MAG: TolC family protein [Magnetococcales bacterium]|nr:TolC family protein [Magnetococcales bacterium]
MSNIDQTRCKVSGDGNVCSIPALVMVLLLGVGTATLVEPLEAASDKTGGWWSAGDLNRLLERRYPVTRHALLKGRSWREITLEQALEQARQNNITLKRQRLQSRVARQGAQIAEANFDPYLAFSVNYSRSKTYDRTEKDWKFKKATIACPTSNPACVRAQTEGLDITQDRFTIYDSESPVAFLMFDQKRPGGYYPSTIDASEADPTGPDKSTVYTLSITQPLPSGMDVNVTQTTTRKDNKYAINASSDDPTVGSYGRPWTTSVSGTVSLPVPYARNWGDYASRENELLKTGVTRQQASADLRRSMNDTLHRVGLAYWNLVRSAHLLKAMIDSRGRTAALTTRIGRLVEAGLATRYAQAQSRAEQARLNAQETQALNQLLTASNALNELLVFDPGVIYLPAGYREALDRIDARPEITLSEAIQEATTRHPDLARQRLAIRYAEIQLNSAKSNARPDASLALSVSGSQSNAVYGFKSFEESMTRVSRPDRIDLSSGVSYRYPWQNKAAHAAVGRLREERLRLQTALARTQRRITQEVQSAYANWLSAAQRVQNARRKQGLAAAAYQRVSRLYGRMEDEAPDASGAVEAVGGTIGDTSGEAEQTFDPHRVTEYEVIVKSGELLAARQQTIQQHIGLQEARFGLQAAMGKLGSITPHGTDTRANTPSDISVTQLEVAR